MVCSATTCLGDEESSAKISGGEGVCSALDIRGEVVCTAKIRGGEVICSAIKDDEDEKEVIYEALGVGGVVVQP